MFTLFKNRRLRKERAKALYGDIVAQSRLRVFYEQMAVPDSVDGRFEMIALHCYILMRRLQAAGEKKQSQALFDVFFKTMDISLREMGIGDLGVPKHMKRMMQGFNGRAIEYEKALASGDEEALKQALIRNVYGTVKKPNEINVVELMQYVAASAVMTSLDAVFAPLDTQEKKRA